jgi:hypothetical protein
MALCSTAGSARGTPARGGESDARRPEGKAGRLTLHVGHARDAVRRRRCIPCTSNGQANQGQDHRRARHRRGSDLAHHSWRFKIDGAARNAMVAQATFNEAMTGGARGAHAVRALGGGQPAFSAHEAQTHVTFLTGVGFMEGSGPSVQPPAPCSRLASRNELTVSPDSDLSRPLPDLAACFSGSLPLGVDCGRIMRETPSDLRFSSAAERRCFCEAWLDHCVRLLTTFTWLAACDARFWPADDEAEPLRRKRASEETLRPALAAGYAQLLTETGSFNADTKDILAYYLPEALALGATRALRSAFPRSSAQLSQPDLPQHLFSSVAKLMSEFGHGRIPGASPLRSLAPAPRAPRALGQGSAPDTARDWNVEQVCLSAEFSLPYASRATFLPLAYGTSCHAHVLGFHHGTSQASRSLPARRRHAAVRAGSVAVLVNRHMRFAPLSRCVVPVSTNCPASPPLPHLTRPTRGHRRPTRCTRPGWSLSNF